MNILNWTLSMYHNGLPYYPIRFAGNSLLFIPPHDGYITSVEFEETRMKLSCRKYPEFNKYSGTKNNYGVRLARIK